MARFHVQRSFLHLHRDLVFLVGHPTDGEVGPGDRFVLPDIGEVLIASLEWVRLEHGGQAPALTFQAAELARDADFDPASLEGTEVKVISADS